jgi:DNA invertase Pin-like site-specific DNA recombinase
MLSDEDLCRYIAPRIVELRREGKAVDRQLYEKVARELGIGRSTVERIINIKKTPQYDTWRNLAEAGVLRLSPATKSENS